MSQKDIKIYIIKEGPKAGCLFISNYERTNGKFFDPSDLVDDVLSWLYTQKDVPEFQPKRANMHSVACEKGRKSAIESIKNGSGSPNPYNKRLQYEEWNDWCAGHYYTMK